MSINIIMTRKFVDIEYFRAGKMERDGNIDFRYWHDKTINERLEAAARMIEIAFDEPNFLIKKVDRTIFNWRKHSK
jgi:hypothetical protein